MAIIEIDRLTKRFGARVAVDAVSLEVAEGEVFGLLGPNGAGKTTTIRVMTTLIPPTSGRVTVAGLTVGRHDRHLRSVIGYVPQALSADGTLSGYENLLVFGKLMGLGARERAGRIREALSLMRLEEAAHRTVQTYSGGMVRRLEIGQALLQRPRVLVLDEPTVGLDPTARRAIWSTLHALREETALTVFMTTHSMEEANQNCDRVAVMHRGRIAGLGTPEALKAATGIPDADLDDVFTRLTGEDLDVEGGTLREHRQVRGRQRLG